MSALVVLLAMMAVASPSAARNWGAGIPPDEDARCTEGPPSSQCTAQDSFHTVFIPSGVNSFMQTALENSLLNDYDAIEPDVWASRTTSFTADVRVYETNLGPVARRGYTTCESGAATGEDGTKNMWCRPQLLYLNNHYENSEWNVSGAIRKWLSCHELGHTLGLQHPKEGMHDDWNQSCMRTNLVPGPADLRPFDVEHLKDCYPHHPFTEPPLCRED